MFSKRSCLNNTGLNREKKVQTTSLRVIVLTDARWIFKKKEEKKIAHATDQFENRKISFMVKPRISMTSLFALPLRANFNPRLYY